MMHEILQYLAGGAMLIGAVFSLLASVGIIRLPDLYTRMHAASKAGTMGSGLMLVAIALVALEGAVIVRAIVGLLFLFLTAPVSAHLLARAALLSGHTPASRMDIFELDIEDIK
jgi:multicomponent Na+:H+ antiporter subunit G